MTDVVAQGVLRNLQEAGALSQMPCNLRAFAGNVRRDRERELLQYFNLVVLDKMKGKPIEGLLRGQLLHLRTFLGKHLEPLNDLYPQMADFYKLQNPYSKKKKTPWGLDSSGKELQQLTIRLPLELDGDLNAYCKSTGEILTAHVALGAMRGLQEAEGLNPRSRYLRAFAGNATKEQERELFPYFCLVVLDQIKEEQLAGFPRWQFLHLRACLWEYLEPLRHLNRQAAEVYTPK